jgi:hypothetical protein
MALQRQDSSDGNVTLKPQRSNQDGRCSFCGSLIPAGTDYYDVQAWHGSAQACAQHTAQEIRDRWNEGDEGDEEDEE